MKFSSSLLSSHHVFVEHLTGPGPVLVSGGTEPSSNAAPQSSGESTKSSYCCGGKPGGQEKAVEVHLTQPGGLEKLPGSYDGWVLKDDLEPAS